MVWLTPKIKCNFCTSFVLFLYTLKKGFFFIFGTNSYFPNRPKSWHPKVSGEATVRNISEKCRHKLALSLVIIVSSVNFT